MQSLSHQTLIMSYSYPELGLKLWNLEAIAFKERPRKTRVLRGKPLKETAGKNNQLDGQIT